MRKKNGSVEWQPMAFNFLLTAAVPFATVQFLSDVPGGGQINSPRLLRVVGSVNWAYSAIFEWPIPAGAGQTLPYVMVGIRPTNINEQPNVVNMGAALSSDLGYYGRKLWPAPVEISAGGGGLSPIQGGPWVGAEMEVDWPVHRGVGTSPLQHDRAIRLDVATFPAPLGGQLNVSFYGWMLIALP